MREENIARLDVAVRDAALVSHFQCFGDGSKRCGHSLHGPAPCAAELSLVFERRLQRPAVEPLQHREEQCLTVGRSPRADVVGLDDRIGFPRKIVE